MTDTASKTPERNGRITRQVVHVATYEHPHGDDIRVFHDKGDAWDWRTRIAQEWWSNEFDDEPPSEDVIGSEYFDRMADKDGAEYFSVVPCELEIGERVMTDEPNSGTMTSDAFDNLIDDASHAVNNLIPDHLLATLSDDERSNLLVGINDALTLVLADYIERKG
jgi:hypothetical protein